MQHAPIDKIEIYTTKGCEGCRIITKIVLNAIISNDCNIIVKVVPKDSVNIKELPFKLEDYPTTVFYSKDKFIDLIVGTCTKEDIEDFIL